MSQRLLILCCFLVIIFKSLLEYLPSLCVYLLEFLPVVVLHYYLEDRVRSVCQLTPLVVCWCVHYHILLQLTPLILLMKLRHTDTTAHVVSGRIHEWYVEILLLIMIEVLIVSVTSKGGRIVENWLIAIVVLIVICAPYL